MHLVSIEIKKKREEKHLSQAIRNWCGREEKRNQTHVSWPPMEVFVIGRDTFPFLSLRRRAFFDRISRPITSASLYAFTFANYPSYCFSIFRTVFSEFSFFSLLERKRQFRRFGFSFSRAINSRNSKHPNVVIYVVLCSSSWTANFRHKRSRGL